MKFDYGISWEMDFLTHSLIGLALARAGLSRFAPNGTLVLFVALNIPDIDYLSLFNGPLAAIEQHAGYTHSLVGSPVLVLLTVLLFRARSSWLRSGCLATIGIVCHLLLDWSRTWGIRPLLPFSSRWFHLDFNGPFDLFLLAILGVVAVWPYLSKLVSLEIGARPTRGRGSAILGLCALVLIEIARAVLHQQAVGQLEARLFDGAAPLRVAAIADPGNPLKWTGIVETDATYRYIPINVMQTFDADSGQRFFKPGETPAIRQAKSTEPFRYFLYFARFPVWTAEPVLFAKGAGQRVELTDLRFGTPGDDGMASLALEDGAGGILKSWFTFAAQKPAN